MDAAPALTPDRVLRRLEWRVIRRLDGRLQGDYRTLIRGQGTDFRDLREYEPGDDVRHVDWNVTARMDALYVREYTEDRELTAWLLLDRSPSMGFGPVDRTKERLLRDFTTTISRLLVRNGNRVGAIVYDNDVSRAIPPRQGRDQVLLLVRDLLRPVEAGRETATCPACGKVQFVSTPAAPAPDSLATAPDKGATRLVRSSAGGRGKEALLALERGARSLDPDPEEASYFELLSNSARIFPTFKSRPAGSAVNVT